MKKKIIFLTILLALTLGLASCMGGGLQNDKDTGTDTQTQSEYQGKYTLTFDSDGGSYVPDQKSNEDDKFYEPKPPTKEGNTFAGWYDESWKWDFELRVATRDVTLKAKWIPDQLKVEAYSERLNEDWVAYVAGDGTYDYGHTVNVSATPRTDKEGLIFLGWYENDTLVSADYEFSFDIKSNRVFMAKWAPLETTIVSSKNNGAYFFEENMENMFYFEKGAYKLGETVTICAKNANGYLLNGWYKDDVLVAESEKLTFQVELGKVAYSVGLKDAPEMEIFDFYRHNGDCVIRGIKDKTVTEIVVPDYVTWIQFGAFKGCSNLQKITSPLVGSVLYFSNLLVEDTFACIFGDEEYEGSTMIYQYMVGYGTNGEYYYIPSTLKEVTITKTKNLPLGAFSNCNQIEVIHLAELWAIPEKAFYKCTALKTIYYGGTREEWDLLEKGANWDTDTAFEVICIDEIQN